MLGVAQRRQKPPKSPEHKLQYAREYHELNKEKHQQQMAAWHEANPGRNAELSKNWREANPGYASEWSRLQREGRIGPFSPKDGPDWQKRNREAHLQQKRANTNRRRKELFLEALKVYGGDQPGCYCCGETHPVLLGLDHINGGGNKHRKAEKMSHASEWAKRNNWPAIFRVACHSCNLGAHLNGGVCPHQGKG